MTEENDKICFSCGKPKLIDGKEYFSGICSDCQRKGSVANPKILKKLKDSVSKERDFYGYIKIIFIIIIFVIIIRFLLIIPFMMQPW